ncbi:MAG: adenylate cyclase [Ignavibacteria bacterium]|nr:MAG: adenylate cyclase [Ignavibacteria bacterium]KAF0160070.1 MAG: adenylate cyclase [Ignavibacteria bacterium]
MPLNLELKIKLNSHKQIEAILKKNKAEFKGILKQKDVYYKTSKGLLKLRVEGERNTLIKYLRDEKGKRWSNYELLELRGKNPEKYLESIFKIEAIVEKKRKLYIYDNTRVHLDEVKGLGKFLELETLLIGEKSKATKRFNFIKKLLGIENEEQIRTSYRNLIFS